MLFTRYLLVLLLAGGTLIGCASEKEEAGAVDVLLPALKEHVSHHDNGCVSKRFTYYLDEEGGHVKHGLWKTYTRKGQLGHQVEYRDGERHGESMRFHADGALAKRGSWDHGKETGPWQAWHQGGELQWNATYREGRIVGKRMWWSGYGLRVTRRETYDVNGKLAKMEGWRWDRSKGKNAKSFEGSYKNGLMHGTWTYWFPDGRVKAVGEWKESKPWGGICAVPAGGEIGSLGGFVVFKEFKDGTDLGQATLPPDPQPKPKDK